MNKEIDFASLGFPSLDMYGFPNIINAEVYTGGCPCHCVHCPVGITESARRKERFQERGMSLELYEKIVEEISEHPGSTLRIHSAGEPLMWPDLVEALEMTQAKSVTSWLFTCAVTDSVSLLEAICENTRIIEVSVNSINPEDYRATKGIDAFLKVVKNIKYMNNFIKCNGFPTRLIVSRVQSVDINADEEFVGFWRSSGLVDDAFVRTYHTYNDLLDRLPCDEENRQPRPCLVHWGRLNLSVDGYSVVCFNELFKEHLDPSLILGDVRHQTIAEIWHGSKLTALRSAALRGNYSDLPFSGAVPCEHCSSCQPLHGSGRTSEYQIHRLYNRDADEL